MILCPLFSLTQTTHTHTTHTHTHTSSLITFRSSPLWLIVRLISRCACATDLLAPNLLAALTRRVLAVYATALWTGTVTASPHPSMKPPHSQHSESRLVARITRIAPRARAAAVGENGEGDGAQSGDQRAKSRGQRGKRKGRKAIGSESNRIVE